MEDHLIKEKKQNREQIIQKEKKKKQMHDQMKIIAKYEQNKKFAKVNKYQNDADEAPPLEKHQLTEQIMEEFMNKFKLDEINEL